MAKRETTAWFVRCDPWEEPPEIEVGGVPATVSERKVKLSEAHSLARYRRVLDLADLDETRDAAFARAIEKARRAEAEAQQRLKAAKAALRALQKARKQ